jgi:hypothetical protein
MRPEHRHVFAKFIRIYAPGALCLLALVASCDLRQGAFDLDSDKWTFRNHTNARVHITPLYTGKDNADHVVPRFGWDQTRFGIAPNAELTINLSTGDFPFDRVLVESPGRDAWTIPVQASPVDIVSAGSPSRPADRDAKLEPTLRRLKLYVGTAAVPLLWTLPILIGAELVRRRREHRLVKTT